MTHLDEVVITNTRLQNYATGHYLQNVDTLTTQLAVATNAAELLRKFGFGHIRSYGVGGLTTPSFRGTGASHTAVLWNGINIISPLNGQSDLSLLPVNFIDDVQLQSGGSASLYGSGAIGGTIQFNNKARFGQGLNVSLTENIGSFKTFFHGLSATWSGKKWVSSTRLFQTSAENNFPFINKNYTIPRREVRQHNAFEQLGILQQNYFQLNRQQLLSLRFWFQDNYTEVPVPTTVSRPATSSQRDKFFRSMVGWNYDYSRGHLFVQSAHVYHMLDYRYPEAVTTFNSFINIVENSLNISDAFEWTGGINNTTESAIGHKRNRTALYSAIKLETGRWHNVLSARQEFIRDWFSPLAPSLGLEYHAHRTVSVFGNVSHNYRIPTFNDLYWNDAGAKGNPDLRMETSWSEELGFKLRLQKLLTGQLAVFSNHVGNMIYWQQSGGIWSPTNISKIWSRGLETMGTMKRSIAELTGRYTYTLSTTEAGRQLVFTPRHESSVTARVTWHGWSLSATNTYIGRQYTDDSNNQYLALKGYNLFNVWVSKDLHFKSTSVLFMTELNNLFDQQVSTRPGYPLPGRNIKAGITIRFNKPIEI